MDLLILLVLFVEVFLLIKFDRIIYGTWITPFSLLAFPYAIIVAAAFFFAPALGFIPLYVESVLVWIVGLFLFWLAGSAVALPLGRSIRAQAKRDWVDSCESRSEKPVQTFAWISIFVMCYGLLISIRSLGWTQIGSDAFGELYGPGLVGHFRCFSIGLAIFMIGTARWEKKFGLFTALLLIALYMMYPVKSWVLIPILAGLIYRVSRKRRAPSLKKLAAVIFIGLIIFLTAYSIQLGVNDIETLFMVNTYEREMLHFVQYIFSGVLGFGEVIREGIGTLPGNPLSLFAPFANLYAVVFSGDLTNITGNSSIISLDGLKISNVQTFFGTILINLGVLPGVAYVIFLGAMIYGLFALARITRNCWAMVVWTFFGAMLFFGWFEYYFGTLTALEVPVFCVFIGFSFRLFERKK